VNFACDVPPAGQGLSNSSVLVHFSLAPDVLVLQQEAVALHDPFNFVLANGEIHDWILLTLDGPQYLPQINQELGI
jgi:hypothetical protein